MGEGQEEVVSLSILDTYKVRWDRWTVVRDVMQNFFDEVEAFEQIKIEVDRRAKRVRVEGPVSFALDYIRYVGATSKGAEAGRRTAGGFGEGFKVCALVLLRDYGVRLKAGSKGWSMEARLTPRTYGDGRLLGRELEYVLGEGSQQEGSYVELEGVDARMMKLFEGSSALFHHKTNPRLGRPIWVDWERGMGLYHAANARRGEVYYRRQQRGWLPFRHGSGVSVAYDGRIEALEGDRDRRKLKSPLRVLEAVLEQAPLEVLEGLVWQLRGSWRGGRGVMKTLLRVGVRRGLTLTFPERWVAGSRAYGDRALVELATRRGWRVAIPEMVGLGMAPIKAKLGQLRLMRAGRGWEQQRWEIASRLYEELSGEAPGLKAFRVLELPKRYGEMSYGTHTAVVHAEELDAPFEVGVCSLMVSMGRQAGAKRRSNADRITALLDGALGRHEGIARARERWDAVEVRREGMEASLEVSLEDAAMEGVVEVVILAPAGWWVHERLAEQVRAVCTRAGTPFVVRHIGVQDERGARVEGARGVPSVWIGAQEVGGKRGGKPGYRVRVYKEAGEERYMPGERLLEEALKREVTVTAKGRRHRWRAGRRELAGYGLQEWSFEQDGVLEKIEEIVRDEVLQAQQAWHAWAKALIEEHPYVGPALWDGFGWCHSAVTRWCVEVGEEEARSRYMEWVEALPQVIERLEAWRGEEAWVSEGLASLIVAGVGWGPGWEERLEETLRRADEVREEVRGYALVLREPYGVAMVERLERLLGREWQGGEALAGQLREALARMRVAVRPLLAREGERHKRVVARCLDEALGEQATWADPWGEVAREVGALGREASAEDVLERARQVWSAYEEGARFEYHRREGYGWGSKYDF